MLGKLIKHDFRSLSRTLVPANIAILGATIIAALGLTFNLRRNYNNVAEGPLMNMLQTISVILIVIMVIAIIAAFFFILFMIFQRFYKNFMTSEGYLTFTLPAKTSNLLWSKLITAIIWTAISTLVGILCLFIFLTFGTADSGFANTALLKTIGDAFRALGEVYTSGVTVIIIEAILFIIASAVSSILHVYLALIIGGTVSQKHKLGAGIGFYFVINMAMSIISSIVMTVFATSISDSVVISGSTHTTQEAINSVVASVQPVYWVMMALLIVFSVAFFILSHYFLKNKLNLE